MNFGTIYPVITDISATAGSTLLRYARKQEKDLRNLAQLPIYTFPDAYQTETFGTMEAGTFKVIEKKKKITKVDWALTWNASLLAHASRYNHLVNILKPEEVLNGKEETVREGETASHAPSREEISRARLADLTPEQKRKAATILHGRLV